MYMRISDMAEAHVRSDIGRIEAPVIEAEQFAVSVERDSIIGAERLEAALAHSIEDRFGKRVPETPEALAILRAHREPGALDQRIRVLETTLPCLEVGLSFGFDQQRCRRLLRDIGKARAGLCRARFDPHTRAFGDQARDATHRPHSRRHHRW